MKTYLRRLFQYDRWASGQSLPSVYYPMNTEALRVMAHILNAEKIWLMRLHGEDSSGVPVFRERSIAECEELGEELYAGYLEFIDSLAEEDIDKLINYKNTKGEAFQTSIKDILTHVAFHGAYHRGQAALLVRQEGGTAAPTDYIIFTRV